MNDCKTSITESEVFDSIESEEYLTVGKKTTVCILTLKNGFEVVGTSACVDPSNYSLEIGKPYAKEKAMQQVWMHLASILQAKLHQEKEVEATSICPETEA